VGIRLERFTSFAAAAAISGTVSSSQAQGNMRPAPTGGRSQLMGGTGIALGDDSAAPFLNPAAIARIVDTGIAFSSGFYTFQQARFSNFHQPVANEPGFGALSFQNADLNRGRLDGFPATICLFLAFRPGQEVGPPREKAEAAGKTDEKLAGRQKIAGCLGLLERNVFDATGQSFVGTSGALSTNQALSVTHRWNRLYAGPTYSIYVSDRLALGATLNGIATTVASTYSLDSLTSGAAGGTVGSIFDTSLNAYSVDAGLLLGLIYHIDHNQILGVSVSTPALHVVGGYRGTSAVDDLTAKPSGVLQTSTGRFVAPPPVRLGAGLGAEIGRLRVEGDATAWVPVQPFARATASGTETILANGVATSGPVANTLESDARPILDAAVGLEWYVRPALSLIWGTATDWSVFKPLPAAPPTGTLTESRIERVTMSFGSGAHVGDADLVVGTELSYAWGEAVAIDPFASPPRLSPVEERVWGIMLVVGGRTSFGSLRHALSSVIWGPQK